MKKIIIFLLLVSLCLLCGCRKMVVQVGGTQAPTAGDPTEVQVTEQETFDPDWEMPIDVDENTEETGAVTEPDDGTEATAPEGTKPVTEPEDTDPKETAPQETDPTNPPETEPEESEPQESKPNDGAIVLPFIPG